MRSIVTHGGLLAAALIVAGWWVPADAYATFGRWRVSPVVFYVNPKNADVTATAAETALKTALNAWTNAGSSFRYSYGGRVTTTTTGYDGRNIVVFRSASSGSTIATTYWWTTSSGTIVDADVIFWDGGWRFFTGSAGCSSGAYIEDIAAHELGHALGLKHSSAAGATMYTPYTRCSTAPRSLATDDINGVRALYGGI